MPDSHLLRPGSSFSGKLPLYHTSAHSWSSPQLHKPQSGLPGPLSKSLSAPANGCSQKYITPSTSVGTVSVSKFEIKPQVPLASSPSNPSIGFGDQLREQIISALTTIDEGNTEYDIQFQNVSEDDNDHVMNAIEEIDQLVRKPAYIPHLKCFIAYKMPLRTHDSLLSPVSRVITRVIESMPISTHWDLMFPMRTSAILTAVTKKLGVPDLLLQMGGPGGSIPLWIMEVNYSRVQDELMSSIRRYTTECRDAQAITIIDICESQLHRKPKDTSELANLMKNRSVLTFKEWKSPSDDPAFGSVTSSVPYPWVSPLTITVRTWLRRPDGEFSLDEMNNSPFYARADICPTKDTTKIAHLDLIFQQAMRLIRDKIISYVQEHCELNEEVNLRTMREWTPPDPMIDWDVVMKHVRLAVVEDGFERYKKWHNNLKRRVDEDTEQLLSERSNKKSRKG